MIFSTLSKSPEAIHYISQKEVAGRVAQSCLIRVFRNENGDSGTFFVCAIASQRFFSGLLG